MKHPRWWAYGLVFALTLIWGNAFVAIKYALRYISPTQLLIYRYVPAAALFVLILVWRRNLRLPTRLSRGEGLRLVLAGLCGIPIYNFCLNWGEQHITAGMASLIIALCPGITYLLGLCFQGERWAWRKVVGLMISFGGLSVLVLSAQSVGSDSAPGAILMGALVTMVCPLTWAGYTLLGQPLVKRHSSLKVTAWATILGAVPVLLLIRPTTLEGVSTFPATFWLAILWLVVFCTILAFVAWYWALKRLGATEISVFIYLIPAFAILFGQLLLREPITLSLIGGGALILLGITLVSWQRNEVNKRGD